MNRFWDKGEMSIRKLLNEYDEPRPHFNTLATICHILEDKGFLKHRALSPRNFEFSAAISPEEYKQGSLRNIVDKFFGSSSLSAISALVQNEDVSLSEVKKLIRQVEKNRDKVENDK